MGGLPFASSEVGHFLVESIGCNESNAPLLQDNPAAYHVCGWKRPTMKRSAHSSPRIKFHDHVDSTPFMDVACGSTVRDLFTQAYQFDFCSTDTIAKLAKPRVYHATKSVC